ncbi:MAG: hypothetical protein ACP6IS_09345 [Candidatus Asgardarchaeia archaeon]
MNEDSINYIMNSITTFIDEKNKIRDKAYPIIRHGIQTAAKIINYLHYNKLSESTELIKHLRTIFNQLNELLKDYPDLLYGSFLLNFLQEYVEAELYFSFITSTKIPSPEALGVSPVPYLLGFCDFVSELRRKILILINRGALSEAKKILDIMSKLADSVFIIEVPDSIVPGFKRKKDVIRLVLDRTMSDLIAAELSFKIKGK